MAIVSVVNWQPGYGYRSNRSAWSKGRRPPGAVLHYCIYRMNQRGLSHALSMMTAP